MTKEQEEHLRTVVLQLEGEQLIAYSIFCALAGGVGGIANLGQMCSALSWSEERVLRVMKELTSLGLLQAGGNALN